MKNGKRSKSGKVALIAAVYIIYCIIWIFLKEGNGFDPMAYMSGSEILGSTLFILSIIIYFPIGIISPPFGGILALLGSDFAHCSTKCSIHTPGYVLIMLVLPFIVVAPYFLIKKFLDVMDSDDGAAAK